MGYAIAEEAAKAGAKVILISGPVSLTPPHGVELIIGVKVQKRCMKRSLSRYDEADIVIKSAAVADYRPKTYHDHKMKKQPGEQVIELERTKDILHELGKEKGSSNTNWICCGNRPCRRICSEKIKK